MLALATQQEKHYLQCNNYAARTIAGGYRLRGRRTAGRGDEQERLVRARAIPIAARATAFTVQATAIAGQNQFQDTACRSFSVTAGAACARRSTPAAPTIPPSAGAEARPRLQ